MAPSQAAHDPRLVKAVVFALKVAGQNARHTSFDSLAYRDRFVTEILRAHIPNDEPAPTAKNGARKLPRAQHGGEEQAQAGSR